MKPLQPIKMNTISQDLANVPVVRQFNGLGEAAIHNTATKMRDIINESGKNPYIRRWAERILSQANIPAYDWIGEAKAIHNWVRDNVRYTHDPRGIEYLQTPPTMLKLIEQNERPMGDCDDMTMLVLSLLKSIGYEVGLKIAAYRKDGRFQHVYGMVRVPVGRPTPEGLTTKDIWIPSDTIKPEKQLGWEAPGITRSFTLAT